jgi:hypothetical protein
MLQESIPVSRISSALYSIVSMKQFGQARPLSQHLKFSNALLIRFRLFADFSTCTLVQVPKSTGRYLFAHSLLGSVTTSQTARESN